MPTIHILSDFSSFLALQNNCKDSKESNDSIHSTDVLFFHGGCTLSDEKQKIINRKNEENNLFVKPFREKEIDSDDIIIFSDRQNFYEGWKWLLDNGLLAQTVCMLIESGVVDRKCGKRVINNIKNAFPVFLTYQDDLIDNKKFFKLWPTINISQEIECGSILFEERELASIICTNRMSKEEKGELYSERKRVIEWFENNSKYEFGLFGRRWDGYRNYRGVCREKSEAYHKYKFAICLENNRANGYITEKIFDCFQYGAVPVYGGAPNIEQYIPSGCFIDYFSFENIEELVIFLEKMDETTYNQYIDSIRKFLQSPQAREMDLVSKSDVYIKVKDIINQSKDVFKISIAERLSMFVNIRLYDLNKYYIGNAKKCFWKCVNAFHSKR